MNGLQDPVLEPSPAQYNQQLYQRLKLSLSLGLRRQLFVAVCDDPNLRNRLAGQLHRELVQQGADQVAASIERSGIPTVHENLVSLKLDLNDPNPIAQISHWLRTNLPRPQQDEPMPSFQILGIEQLTRQPAAVQRLFLSYLRALERQLPALNSALILWVTRPWYHNIRKSAPECWQWCSGTFEFMAEPLPLSADERPQTSVPEMEALTPGADSGVTAAAIAVAQTDQPPLSHAALGNAALGNAALDNDGEAGEPGTGEYSAAKVIAAEAALMAASGVDARLSEEESEEESSTEETVPAEPNTANPNDSKVADSKAAASVDSAENALVQTPDSVTSHQALTDSPPADAPVRRHASVTFDRIYQSDGQDAASESQETESQASNDKGTASHTGENQASDGQASDNQASNSQANNSQALAPSDTESQAQITPETEAGAAEPTLKQPAAPAAEPAQKDFQDAAAETENESQLNERQPDEVQETPTQETPTTEPASPFEPPNSVSEEKADAPATQTISHTFSSVAEREEAQLLAHIEVLRQQNASSEDLAISYLDLGRFYRRRMEQGDQSQDFTRYAIVAYEQVLEWLCFNDPAASSSSLSWSDTLNDLGTLYWMASRKPESPEMGLSYIKLAIQTYRLGLKNTDPEDNPKGFAMLQNNLGTVHSDFAHHQDAAENLGHAIDAYKEALRFRQPESAPLKYASTQNNLGTAYWHLAQHANAPENLKWAIAAYSQAAQYYNPDEQPDSYAMIQNNLGTAYWNLAQISPTEESPQGNGHFMAQEWLLLAVNAYNNALRFRTLQVAPGSYASTQNNLGTAYWQLANQTGQEASAGKEYLQLSIRAYEAALKAADFLTGQNMLSQLNFDPFATHSNSGLVHYQLATDFVGDLDDAVQQEHLDHALTHHVQAMTGWKEKPELYEPAVAVLVQTIQHCYEKWGSSGQNRALGRVPGELLPELLPKL